ncbi:tetratricopeptide repeat protein [candidate division WOR-3 bacterium]|nr:tetratricopeptide repeat protein [candidate division WOR-3 bacterium]
MQILMFLSLITLPLGEARENGLADAAVTVADQPLALYVNPALLTRTVNRKLLYSPIGFEFNGTGTNVVSRILDSYTQIGFIGYNQPIGKFGAGLAGFRDESDARGVLVGGAYKFGFLHTGASLGMRYTETTPHVHPAFAVGIAFPDIKFADVPGDITIAAAARWVELFNIQGGIDYSIAFLRFLVNFHVRDLLEERAGLDGTAHLAALINLEDIIHFPLEIGGGWGSDNRFGVLAAADLNLCKINLSFSSHPNLLNPNIRNDILGFSLLFSIASTEEVEERLAAIDAEKQKKNEVTSNTYKTQGIDYYNQKNYSEAINAFDVSLIWNPANDEALDWLQRVKGEQRDSKLNALLAGAEAAIKTGDYLEAMNKAEAALAIDSTNKDAKAHSEEAQRKFSESIFSKTASLRNSGEINALYQKGLEQYAAGDYKGAAETWAKIEKLEPNAQTVKVYKEKTSQKITESLAEGLRELEGLEKKSEWRQALNLALSLQKMAPANQTLQTKVSLYQSKIKTLTSQYVNEGIDYYNRRYYVNAQKSFYAALALEPSNSTAKDYIERIQANLQKKDTDELYLQGVQAYTNHQYQQAINYWQQVLKIDSSYPNVSRNIERAREKLAQLK